MELLLLFIYSVLICYGISRLKIFRQSGIKVQWWCALFLFKVLVGILYGYIHSFSYGGGDTLYSFKQGMRVYNTLHDYGFSTYFKLVFLPCHYPSYAGIDRWTHNSIPYGDEGYYLLVRLHALFALISFGYYNVHVVLFNVLSFAGCAFIYFSFKDALKEKAVLLLIGLCAVPSVVFWTSGIHKDGLALLGIGMLFYSMRKNSSSHLTNPGAPLPKAEREIQMLCKILPGCAGAFLLWIIRPYILFIFLPLALPYFFFQKQETRMAQRYFSSAIIFLLLILLPGVLIPSFSPMEKMVWWQSEFAQLDATLNSVYLPSLAPNVISFLKVLPYSLLHSFAEPFIWSSKNIYQLVISIQELLLLVFLFLFLILRITKKKLIPHLFFLSLGYAFGLYALLGMIVPNLGALSRYKSSGTLFLFIAIISILPDNYWKKIISFEWTRKNSSN